MATPPPGRLAWLRSRAVANVGLLSTAYLLHSLSAFLQALSTTVTASALLVEAGQSTSLASLPYSLLFAVAAFMPPAVAAAVQRLGGYRTPFAVAAAVGVLGGGVAALAVYLRSFATLCVASAILGVPNTAGNFFRFAATTLVPAQHMPKAISAVLLSGLVASVVTSPIANSVYDLLPEFTYLPIYLAISAIYVLMGFLLSLVRYPPPTTESAPPKPLQPSANAADAGPGRGVHVSVNDDDGDDDGDEEDDRRPGAGRPAAADEEAERGPLLPPPPPARTTVRTILASPSTLACMAGAAVPYLVMTVVMSIVPLEVGARFEFGVASNVMSVHAVCMFLPFFVVGILTERMGEPAVLFAGLALLLASVVVMLLSTELWSFFVGMGLVGVGWSLAFLASTTALTKLYLPSERPKTQAVNDVVVFGLVALGTALSALVYDRIAWSGVLYVCLAVAAAGVCVGIANLVARWRQRLRASLAR